MTMTATYLQHVAGAVRNLTLWGRAFTARLHERVNCLRTSKTVPQDRMTMRQYDANTNPDLTVPVTRPEWAELVWNDEGMDQPWVEETVATPEDEMEWDAERAEC